MSGWQFFAPDADAPLVTALPGSPVDGQRAVLTDSTSAPTYTWLLQYVAAKASNKWVFIGGAPGFSEVLTAETTNSATYTDLATSGPAFALPAAGDYVVEVGFFNSSVTSSRANVSMSFAVGGTGAADADRAFSQGVESNSTGQQSVARAVKKTGLTAVTLTAKYKTSAGEQQGFQNRWMRVTPIAIGG